ncbi:succinate dehydrogenase cytochrome b560 subunit, mitochondrial-like isoform X2 [Artemia franciscana]|uniref:succinate dehydrogenase cytochrome b560 subunit, mitochondrial-like isoform X2 n=1 Tax=Artemia franciscana TaxID=6661 RepID=UPI0032DAFB3B
MILSAFLRNTSGNPCLPGSWLRPKGCIYASTVAPGVRDIPEPKRVSPTEDFYNKNKRLNRPMSPHLTIYKYQITSTLSISHRITGVAQSAALSGFAIAAMTLPGMYPMYLETLNNLALGPAIIGGVKFVIALPFMYHLCAGMRHLVWDSGRGFTLQTVYRSGYAVIAASLLLSVAAACV